MVGLVAGNVGAFIRGAQFEPPSRVLKKAILDAIYESSESKNPTFLSYIEEKAVFRVSNASGAELHAHKIYQGEWKEEYESPEVVFMAIGPESGSDGEPTLYQEDELVLLRIPFHYGSSVPFLTEIRFQGKTENLQFDPFSGFVLKEEE